MVHTIARNRLIDSPPARRDGAAAVSGLRDVPTGRASLLGAFTGEWGRPEWDRRDPGPSRMVLSAAGGGGEEERLHLMRRIAISRSGQAGEGWVIAGAQIG